MNELGKQLRERRISLGLTQDVLAVRLHVTRQTVSNYERGLSEPDLETLRRLADALQTDTATLLGLASPAKEISHQKERLPFFLGLGLTAAATALFFLLERQAFAWKGSHYDTVPYLRVALLMMPLCFLLLGWTITQGAACLIELPTLPPLLRIGIRVAVIALIVVYLLALAPTLLRIPLEERFLLEAAYNLVRGVHIGTGWGKNMALFLGAMLRLSRKNKDLTQGQDMV